MDHERVSNYPWIRSQCAERSVTRAEFDALTQRVTKLEAPQNVGTHRRDADIVSVPGYPGTENPTRREELAGRVTAPPTAPALLPCPFCGEPGYNIGSSCDPCVGCLSCEFELSPDRWNRRPPADARLRALAEAVCESDAKNRVAEVLADLDALRAYLRETAR